MPNKKPTTPHRFMMTQILLLQLKPTTTDSALATFFKGVQGMQQHIPCLLAVATGENHSTAHRGFTHGIILHFEDEPHMRDVMNNEVYGKMLEKARTLCEQLVTFEVPESFPLPVVEIPVPSPTPAPSKQQGRPRKTPVYTTNQAEAQLPTTGYRIKVSELLRRNPVRELDPRIVHIVIDQLGVDKEEVTPNASFVEDLNADSLDLVELIMTFEEVFKVKIDDEVAEQLTTSAETQAFLADAGALTKSLKP